MRPHSSFCCGEIMKNCVLNHLFATVRQARPSCVKENTSKVFVCVSGPTLIGGSGILRRSS